MWSTKHHCPGKLEYLPNFSFCLSVFLWRARTADHHVAAKFSRNCNSAFVDECRVTIDHHQPTLHVLDHHLNEEAP